MIFVRTLSSSQRIYSVQWRLMDPQLLLPILSITGQAHGHLTSICWIVDDLLLNAYLSSRKLYFLSCIPIANHKNMTFVRVNILHKRCMEFHLEDTRPHLKCTSRNIGSSPQNNFRFLTADFIQGGGMLPSNVSRCLYFFLFFLISSASCLVQQGNRYPTSTLPTYSSSNTDEMLRRLNDDLESTSRWIKLNGLALNPKK